MTLPPCFVPDAPTRAFLERVRRAESITEDEANPYLNLGFVKRVLAHKPSPRVSYELTSDGAEALRRW